MKDFISSSDPALMQWETAITAQNTPIIKTGPNLNSSVEPLDIFQHGGFKAAMLANIHTGDHGPASLMETLDNLQRADFLTVGASKDLTTACKPCSARSRDISWLSSSSANMNSAVRPMTGKGLVLRMMPVAAHRPIVLAF